MAWASGDFAFMCLRDARRTRLLQLAIAAAVRPGDVVLDVGAGTGILSFFAIGAGASQVHAVEADPLLARLLRESVAANGMGERVRVWEGDALSLALPHADLIVAELVDTGLLAEDLVRLHNLLVASDTGVEARFLPSRYETFVQLLEVQTSFYGYELRAPWHQWSFYSDRSHWCPAEVVARGSKQAVWTGRLGGLPLTERVKRAFVVPVPAGECINAIGITGRVTLYGDLVIHETPAMNGLKVLLLPEPILSTGAIEVSVDYTMGAGLGSFECAAVPARS